MNNRRRLKRLLLSPELFFSLFSAGLHPERSYRVVDNPIPEDAQLVNVRHGWLNEIEILVQSNTFEEVKEGGIVPELRIVLQAVKP